jgi:hypothetical protein
MHDQYKHRILPLSVICLQPTYNVNHVLVFMFVRDNSKIHEIFILIQYDISSSDHRT